MSKGYDLYLSDVLRSIRRIERYTASLDMDDFLRDELVQDGVIRNLEVIGEAVKRLPESLKVARPEMDWRKVAGLRDVLIHQYHGVDLPMVWDIVESRLPLLRTTVESLLVPSTETLEDPLS